MANKRDQYNKITTLLSDFYGKDRVILMRALRDKGETTVEIGKRLGISAAAVRKQLSKKQEE